VASVAVMAVPPACRQFEMECCASGWCAWGQANSPAAAFGFRHKRPWVGRGNGAANGQSQSQSLLLGGVERLENAFRFKAANRQPLSETETRTQPS